MAYKEVLVGDYFKFEKGLGYKGEFLVEYSEVGLVGIDSQVPGGGYKENSEKPYSGPYKEEHVVQSGDVIVTSTDITQDGSVLGSTFMIPESTKFETLIYSGDVLKVIPTRPDEFSPEYLYNLYRVEKYRRKLAYGDTGTTVRRISEANLNEQLVPLPDLKTQESINEVISLIDQQIENNKSLAKNLEALAQSIFRSWFVDFEPVHAKSRGEKPFGMDDETAALFPDSFEESELGLIPKGWGIKTLNQVCFTTIGGLWGADEKSEKNPDNYFCIRGIEIEDLKTQGFATKAPIRWSTQKNYEKRLSDSRHILIGASGAGPVGKSLLWDNNFNNLFSLPIVFSNFVKRFEFESEEMASYAYQILNQMHSSGEIMEFVNGTSVPNLQDADLLKQKKIVMPAFNILIGFNSIIRKFNEFRFNGQNLDLVKLRSALITGLIDGELDAKKIKL